MLLGKKKKNKRLWPASYESWEKKEKNKNCVRDKKKRRSRKLTKKDINNASAPFYKSGGAFGLWMKDGNQISMPNRVRMSEP